MSTIFFTRTGSELIAGNEAKIKDTFTISWEIGSDLNKGAINNGKQHFNTNSQVDFFIGEDFLKSVEAINARDITYRRIGRLAESGDGIQDQSAHEYLPM